MSRSARAGADLEPEIAACGGSDELFTHAPVAGLGDDQTFSPVLLELTHQPFGERRAGVVLRIVRELRIVDGDAGVPQRVAEMAHRREEECDAQLVAPDVRRLVRCLAHPDGIAARIEAVERGAVAVQLVAQHQDEVAHRHRDV